MDPPPEKTKADVVYAIAKAGVGSIPLAGNAFAVLMEETFAGPIARRRERWLNELALVVDDLVSRVEGLTLEALLADEQFVSVALYATRIAIQSHQTEKLAALKSAVLHAALPDAPSEDKRFIFIRLIDELTPTHIRALAVARIRSKDRASYERRIHLGMPELDDGFIRTLVRELQARGLLWMDSDYHFPGNNPNSLGSVPVLADEFLSFIGIAPHKYS